MSKRIASRAVSRAGWLAAGLLLALAGLAAWSWPRLNWRAQLVGRKIQGEFSLVSWSTVARCLYPHRYRPRESPERRPALRAQIHPQAQGDPPCPVQLSTPVGSFWTRQGEEDLIAHLLGEQLDDHIYQRDPVAVRTGDVVLDVGGHLGTFTRIALRQGARLVVAFEPEPVNRSCFQRTFQNEIAEKRVALVEAAAWSEPGELKFTLWSGNSAGGSSVLTHPGSTVAVPAVTIDDTVERLGLKRVDFIKLDIEGAERHALRGARRTLARFGPRVVACVYHSFDDPLVVPQRILEARPSYHWFATWSQAYFY
jgi:FkbM family methyltransferase